MVYMARSLSTTFATTGEFVVDSLTDLKLRESCRFARSWRKSGMRVSRAVIDDARGSFTVTTVEVRRCSISRLPYGLYGGTRISFVLI